MAFQALFLAATSMACSVVFYFNGGVEATCTSPATITKVPGNSYCMLDHGDGSKYCVRMPSVIDVTLNDKTNYYQMSQEICPGKPEVCLCPRKTDVEAKCMSKEEGEKWIADNKMTANVGPSQGKSTINEKYKRCIGV